MLCSLQGNVQIMSLKLCGKHSKHPKKRMEQHFQDVAEKVQHNKKSDTFWLTLLNISTKNQPHNSAVK